MREVGQGPSRSRLNSAVELSCSVQTLSLCQGFFMPLRSSLSGYCATVRTPLHSPTTDAAVPLAFAPPPPPPVSWRFSLLAPRASVPSAANHYLPRRVPKCSAPPAPAAFVDTRHLLCLYASVADCPRSSSARAATPQNIPRRDSSGSDAGPRQSVHRW